MRRRGLWPQPRSPAPAGVALRAGVRCSGTLRARRPPSTGLIMDVESCIDHCWQDPRRSRDQESMAQNHFPLIQVGTFQAAIAAGKKAWPSAPRYCLRQALPAEGDSESEDSSLALAPASLETPAASWIRSALAAVLRELQATHAPHFPLVVEECRAQ